MCCVSVRALAAGLKREFSLAECLQLVLIFIGCCFKACFSLAEGPACAL